MHKYGLINELFKTEDEMLQKVNVICKELDEMDWVSLKEFKRMRSTDWRKDVLETLDLEVENYYQRISSPANMVYTMKLL